MNDERHAGAFWTRPAGIAAILLVMAVGYFLLTEHLAHTIAWLPYAILLACPLMHVFMHGKHGHGGHDRPQPGGDDAR